MNLELTEVQVHALSAVLNGLLINRVASLDHLDGLGKQLGRDYPGALREIANVVVHHSVYSETNSWSLPS